MLIPPTYIESNGLRFLITGMPRDFEMEEFFKLYEKYNVTDVVRTCEECCYCDDTMRAHGICSYEFVFTDGSIPDSNIVKSFMTIVNGRFGSEGNPNACISVHCKAGLGRAPALVAIALIEYGMRNVDAIQIIKRYRNEAFNQKQILALSRYTRVAYSSSTCCSIL